MSASDLAQSFKYCAWHYYFQKNINSNNEKHKSRFTSFLQTLYSIEYETLTLKDVLTSEKKEIITEMKTNLNKEANNEKNQDASFFDVFSVLCACDLIELFTSDQQTIKPLETLLQEASQKYSNHNTNKSYATLYEEQYYFLSENKNLLPLLFTFPEKETTFHKTKLYTFFVLLNGYKTVLQTTKLLFIYLFDEYSNKENEQYILEAIQSHEKNPNPKLLNSLLAVITTVIEFSLLYSFLLSVQIHTVVQQSLAYENHNNNNHNKNASSWMTVVHHGALLLAKFPLLTPTAAKDSNNNNAFTTHVTTSITYTMNLLLYTMVIGNGTNTLPINNNNNNNNNNKDSFLWSHLQLLQTKRGLLSSEADLFLTHLFPSLLQQTGFEWPWSSVKRYTKLLEKKHQQVPAEPIFDSNKNNENENTIISCCPYAVCYSSDWLFDVLLLQVSRRTFKERFANFLPASYDRQLEALQLLSDNHHNNNDEDDEESSGRKRKRNGKNKNTLFSDFPPYYKEAGEKIVQYFTQIGSVDAIRYNEEFVSLVDSAVSILPMAVQLRACINNNTNNNKSISMTAERVEELLERYRLEVVFAALLVYSQLRTPSLVTTLLRQLAPFFSQGFLKMREWQTKQKEQLYQHSDGPMLVNHNSLLTCELSNNNNNNNQNNNNVVKFPVRFSSEAEFLMNQIRYQFYSLEWFPSYVEAYHTFLQLHKNSNTNNDAISIIGKLTAVLNENEFHRHYSVLTAVSSAFQIHFSNHNNNNNDILCPPGVTPDGVHRLPCSIRSGVVLPEIQLENNNNMKNASWEAIQYFFDYVVSDGYLTSKVSSLCMEGALAIRAVSYSVMLENNNNNNNHNSNNNYTIMSLLQNNNNSNSSSDGSADPLQLLGHLLRNNNNENDPHSKDGLLLLLKLLSDTPVEKNEKRVKMEENSQKSNNNYQLLEDMLNVFKKNGATSFFYNFIEVKDLFYTLFQSFIPTFNEFHSNDNKADLLLKSAFQWSKQFSSQINNIQQKLKNNNNQNQSLVPLYNSNTFDRNLLARNLLLNAKTKLIQKIEQYRKEEERFQSILNNNNNQNNIKIDPLLKMQLAQWNQITSKYLTIPNNNNNNNKQITPLQFLFFSPYFIY